MLGENDVMGVQMDYVASLLKPIASKCLGLVEGNHEWMAKKRYARDIYWELCRQMAAYAGVEPGALAVGASGFFLPTFVRKTGRTEGNNWRLRIFAHHGYGGGMLHGAHALTLGRVLGNYEADIALLGHRHVFSMVSNVISTYKGNQYRYGAFVPSYLGAKEDKPKNGKPFDSYAEQMGLPATPMGTFPIRIIPDERKVVFLVEFAVAG